MNNTTRYNLSISSGESFVRFTICAVDILQLLKRHPFAQLIGVHGSGIEHRARKKLLRPIRLHLNNEMSIVIVGAFDIYNRIFFCGIVGYIFGSEILNAPYLHTIRQGQERIQEAHHEVRMLSENLFEGQIRLRVEILGHSFSRFCCGKDNVFWGK